MQTINGTYGASQTPCDVHCVEVHGGVTWYAVDGSLNVNATVETLEDGVDVETLADCDAFTASVPIDSPETLESELED